MNDYLTLNQSCIKPIMKKKDGTAGGGQEEEKEKVDIHNDNAR
jgi:hypothetical protein